MRDHINTLNKLLSLFLLCWLTATPAVGRFDYQVINKGNKQGLIDDKGNELIPAVHDRLGWTNGTTDVIEGVIGYARGERWGLISVKNSIITEPVYSQIYPHKNGLLIASKNSDYSDRPLFGVLDAKGSAKLGFQYHSLSPGFNYLVAGQLQEGRMKWGVLDFEENEIVPIKYDKVEIKQLQFVVYLGNRASVFSHEGKQITEFHYDEINELGSFSLVKSQIGKEGLLDNMGREITSPIYKNIRLTSDSTALLTEFPKWQLIVPGTGVVKEFYYDHIEPVSNGIYVISANGKQAIINIEEDYLVDGNDWTIDVQDPFVIIKEHNKYGVLKEGGLEVLPAKFDSIYFSGKHFYTLERDAMMDRWQIYSTFGSAISSSYYEQVFPMSEDLIALKKNGYWGYIDFSGHTVIDFIYDYAWPFKEGRAKVTYLGNQGIINTAGEWVVHANHSAVTIVNKDLFINHAGERLDLLDGLERVVYQTYNNLEPHSFGLKEITSGGRIGLINHSGTSVIPPQYHHISDLVGDHFYILMKDGRYGVIDEAGELVFGLTDEFEHIGSLSEGFLAVKKDGRFGFIDFDGNLRIANRYDQVGEFQEGMAPVQLLNKWGFIDRLERLRIQPLYDTVQKFNRGVSVVSKNGRYGIINMQGSEVLPIQYDSIYQNDFKSFILIESGLYGLADFKGELLFPAKFERLEESRDALLIVKQRGKYGVIKKNGINVIPIVYEEIIFDDFTGNYLAKKASVESTISTR